jgi:cellulose synthase/poly-beta-1,6-N-acetylglucosamine synthase-like glycosyltransferase
MIVIEIIVLAYFAYVVSYTAVFSLGGLFYKNPKLKLAGRYNRFAVLIPSYKEDSVIVDVAANAVMQNYPLDQYRVFVIADSLQPGTVQNLKKLPINVVEVSFDKSTKVKSLNRTLDLLNDDQFDFAVILDADNVMDHDFLQKMNGLINEKGYQAIQGQRKPKNQNNNLAFLDGVSEAINNHIYRQGQTALGLSASISGSGVVFNFKLLKQKLSEMNSVGGFDRELELKLLLENVPIYYFKEAIVYDEKISKSNAFQNQRKRWISSQYFYLRKYFKAGCLALLKGNFTFFNSAVLRNIQLPRLINIGLLTLLTVSVVLFGKDYLFFGREIWVTLFSLNTLFIFLSIPKEFYSVKMLRALIELPRIFFNMVLLLFKLKNANKKFIHTPHGVPAQK